MDTSDAEAAAGRVERAWGKAEKTTQQSMDKTEKQAQQRAAREQRREESRLAGLAAMEDRYAMADYRRRNAYERRKEQESSREQRREESRLASLDKLQDRYVMEDYRRRVTFEKKKLDEQEKAHQQAAASVERFAKRSFFAVSAVALLTARAVTAAYAEIQQKAKESADQVGETLLALREPVAVAGGAAGPGFKNVAELGGFMGATLMRRQQAEQFVTEWQNAAGVASEAFRATGGKVGFTEAQAPAMREAVGRMVVRTGMPGGEAAELASMLATKTAVKGPQDLADQMTVMYRLAAKGMGPPGQIMQQYREMLGGMVGPGGVGAAQNPAELAAMLNFATGFATPDEAKTQVQNLHGMLLSGLTRGRKLGGGVGVMTNREYFQKLGIREGMTDVQRLNLLIPDVQKAMAGGRDIDSYLRERGIVGKESIGLIRNMAVGTNFAQFTGGLKEAGGMLGAGGGAKLDQLFRESQAGQVLRPKVALDISQLRQGVTNFEWQRRLEEAVASDEYQRSQLGMPGKMQDWITGKMTLGGDERGRFLRAREIAMRKLMTDVKAAGMGPVEIRQAQGIVRQGGPQMGDEDAVLVNALDQIARVRGRRLSGLPGEGGLPMGQAMELKRVVDELIDIKQVLKAPPEPQRRADAAPVVPPKVPNIPPPVGWPAGVPFIE